MSNVICSSTLQYLIMLLGNSMSNLTDKGVDTLKSLGITAAFDFRSKQEIQQYGIMR
jgi:hypothetical protein